MYERNNDEASYEVSTIHSFCLTNILGPYHWKLPNYVEGYEILPSDSEKYEEIVKSICHYHDLDFKLDVKRSFEQLARDKDGSPIASYPLDSNPGAVTDFWNKLESAGYIDFTNIVYSSYLLISRYPSIAKSVACKFAWILIDELQDTTALQYEVFKKIAGFNITKFFLVGDPKQSIYGFAGAKPDLMYDFSTIVQADTDFVINHNWRSSPRIVRLAEKLMPRLPQMVAVGDQSNYEDNPYYGHCNSPFDAIVGHFLPALREQGISFGDAAILAPWWITLYKLGKQLSTEGIHVVGPGARPYRRSKYLFIRFVEKVCEYLETRETYLIQVLERELFFLVRELTGNADFRIFTFWGRRILICLLRQIGRDTEPDYAAIIWLPGVVETIGQTLQLEEIIGAEHRELLSQSVQEMTEEISRNSNAQLLVRDMALVASYSRNIKLLTLHGSKGLEFDAVALIDLHEGRIPHFSIEYKPQEEQEEMIEESKRLLYVGITRAKRILMYFTHDNYRNDPPSRLLKLL